MRLRAAPVLDSGTVAITVICPAVGLSPVFWSVMVQVAGSLDRRGLGFTLALSDSSAGPHATVKDRLSGLAPCTSRATVS